MAKASSTSLRQPFTANLRRLRTTRDLSQEKLAERARLHHMYVGSAERGERNISIDKIGWIADAVDVAIADLGMPERRGR